MSEAIIDLASTLQQRCNRLRDVSDLRPVDAKLRKVRRRVWDEWGGL